MVILIFAVSHWEGSNFYQKVNVFSRVIWSQWFLMLGYPEENKHILAIHFIGPSFKDWNTFGSNRSLVFTMSYKFPRQFSHADKTENQQSVVMHWYCRSQSLESES